MVERSWSQSSCPVCRQTAVSDSRGGGAYLRCTSCGLLFAPRPPKSYDASYWDPERHEAIRREREDAFVRALELVWLSRRPVNRLLDFGCGYGETVRLLRETLGLDAVGIDPFGQFSETEWLRRIDVDAALEEFGEASFDALLSVEVFEHLDDPLAVTGKLAKLFRPGGALLLNTATQEFLAEAGPDVENAYLDPSNLGHVSVYSLESLREVGSQVGLELVGVGSRKYEVLLVKNGETDAFPLDENLTTLRRLGAWFPHLLREYLRLVDVEQQFHERTAWALELDAALRSTKDEPSPPQPFSRDALAP
jgi:SAM-dependent methyltransferase